MPGHADEEGERNVHRQVSGRAWRGLAKRSSESEAAMPQASRRLSLAVGEAGGNIQRKSESEAAIREF